jgi:hypothetical protein
MVAIADVTSDGDMPGYPGGRSGPPFKTAEFDILNDAGISQEGTLIDLGVDQSIVRKSDATYTYEGVQLGEDKESARNYLRQNLVLADEIEKKIREELQRSIRRSQPTKKVAVNRPK